MVRCLQHFEPFETKTPFAFACVGEFHSHQVDSHSYGSRDEHDVSVYGEVLVYRSLHSLVQ